MTERESDTYRRGLTLGLTMAEIFILILFLLLLVLLALYAFNAETERKLQAVEVHLKQTQTELAETEEQLQEAKDTARGLQAKLDGIDRSRSPLPEEIERLVLNNSSLKDDLSDAEAENTIATKLLEEAKIEQAQTERELDTMKDVQAVIYDNQRPGESLADTAERLQNTYQENDEIHEENSRLHTENAKLRAELSAEKGIDPPCWYQVTNRQGNRHEKPYFLMDIAVYDKYLEIRVQEAPLGHAIDELDKRAATSYQEEYEKLSLPPLGTTKKVSLQQFAEITGPIKRMGKNEQIRDYACVFYVKVWDFTPETAKTRWKQAEDAIKESFYTYRVKNDPW